MRQFIRRGLLLVMSLPLAVATVRADVTININQVGSDVIMSGSGTIDLTDLDSGGLLQLVTQVSPSDNTILLGTPSTNVPNFGHIFTGDTGPSSFGSGAAIGPTSGSGTRFLGIDDGAIVVPAFYASGTYLTESDTFANQTFSTLGLTPGTYIYSWGSGVDADSLTLQIGPIAVPEPSTAVVAVFGAFGLIAYGWSRHRRKQRRQAAA